MKHLENEKVSVRASGETSRRELMRALAMVGGAAAGAAILRPAEPVVGTVHWLTVGIRTKSSPAEAASMVLAGLHILLFAVRVWLAPLIWIVETTGR